MKYMCLICADRMMEDLPAEETRQHFQEYLEFTESIRRRGQLVGGNRLLPPTTATTIRVRDGDVIVTDGPYSETKEQLGGYYLIQARDLNDAIQVAARIPGARYGCVELRPVADDPQTRALGLETLSA